MPPWTSRAPPKRPRTHDNIADQGESSQHRAIPQSAYIQAYEAQLIYGRQDIAHELASRDERGQGSSSRSTHGALMKWQGEGADDREIWVDRSGCIVSIDRWKPEEEESFVIYDILHLLSELPETSNEPPPSPASTSSSWESIPSDAEDTFFLSGSEDIEEYERSKKRRWMDAMREYRLREKIKEEDSADKQSADTEVQADKEEPPDSIRTLMSHTALSLSSSPSPGLLEIRILTHHANDDRFAFLNGRWKHAWQRAKADARKGKEPEKKAKEKGDMGALMGGYGSSDEGSEEGDESENEVPPPPPEDDAPPPEPVELPDPKSPSEADAGLIPEETIIGRVGSPDEAEKQRIRRQRAEEWKRNRAAAAK